MGFVCVFWTNKNVLCFDDSNINSYVLERERAESERLSEITANV